MSEIKQYHEETIAKYHADIERLFPGMITVEGWIEVLKKDGMTIIPSEHRHKIPEEKK
jgi:hypothetical protein